MNLKKLHEAEANFLLRYPEGFADPGIKSIRKKHNVDKVVEFAQENLSKAHCNKPQHVADTLWKIVSRSSMVSRFEKPPFRAFIDALGSDEKEALAYAIEQLLHGKKQQGFEAYLGMLAHHKIAKWAVISAVPFYYAPKREAFVKPTTAKGIIRYLEVEDLKYQPTPNWAFYKGYRALLAKIRKEVHAGLSPNNAALSGFMMMSL